MTLETEISRPNHRIFRRAYIRRRSNTTGLYEADWYEITKYVERWGNLSRSIDDLRLNRITHGGISLTVRNDTGAFNTELNENSLWYGYMTRYRTLIKIEGGYFDENENELPANPTLGIFIMTDEIPISAEKNTATIKARSIVSVFDEVRASEVGGLGPTQTASELIGRIRDHTDGAGNFFFRQFVSLGAWTIQTTTALYNLATSTVIGSLSCWEFIEKMAEAEGFISILNRTGGFEFRNRDARTSTSTFDLRGLGYARPNVIALTESKEAYNKLYTFFRLQFLEADTSTSFVTAGSTSTVDPSSTAWKYGSRTYNFKTTYINNTATAQTIVNNLHAEFSELKNEISLRANFIPDLEISDHAKLYYRSYALESTILWDLFRWDVDRFPPETGENFDWDGVSFKILSINTDLDQFTTTLNMREI